MRPVVFLPWALAAFALAACATPQAAPPQNVIAPLVSKLEDPTAGVMVVAHRGCWRDAPENSLAAIEACIAMGVEMVELDVRATADGVLVLMHDETVERTTDGVGAINALTLAEVRGLRLREGAGGPAAAITDEGVPTFREALEAVRGRVLFNVDAKEDVYDAVGWELAEAGMTDHVLMKTSAPPDAPRLRQTALFASVQFMPIVRETWGLGPLSQIVPGYGDLNPVAYEVLFDDIAWMAEGADDARADGVRMWANTLSPRHSAGITDPLAVADPEGTWGRLIDAGVDMIQTDEPEALMAYLAARRTHADAHARGE